MGDQQRVVSRRTVTQGIAWTAPVVAMASAAPAFAASPGALGEVCKIYEGGGTQNYQTQYVYFKITPTEGNTTIPRGTTLTWTFTVGTSSRSSSADIDFEVPNVSYSSAGLWSLTTSKQAGTPLANGESFTVTWTATQNIPSTDLGALRDCSAAYIIWNDLNSASIDPNTQITVVNPASSTNPSSSLTWITPERALDNVPLVFINSSTGCYPEVQYSNFNNSFTSSCDTSNACVTYQTAGVTAMATMAKGSGDQSVAATCNPASLANCASKTFTVSLADLTTSGTKTARASDGTTYQFTYTTSNNSVTLLSGNLTTDSSGNLWLRQRGAASQTAGSTVGQQLDFVFPTPVANLKIGLANLSNTGDVFGDGYQDQITLYSSTNNTGWAGVSGLDRDSSNLSVSTYYRNALGSTAFTAYNSNSLTSFGLLFNNRKKGTASSSTYSDMSITSITFDAYVCP